jgi:hypothetical protein
MEILEREADGDGLDFELGSDADGCYQWMPLRRRDLAMRPTLGPSVNWQQAADGCTFCPDRRNA